ncbi:MAG: lipid carrier protein [Rhodospirillales bacterium]|nr:lipid carrier protein [Rhodospirillales bacterium]MBT5519869.1 lipid carrier protein [Rhodospirillales bacterium]
MDSVTVKHPDVFERLSELENIRFLIDPVDLPFGFLLIADVDAPELRAVKEGEIEPDDVAATIRGPLMVLIEMLEGKIDGDAQFFSRSLVVEGDTEAVVALRNAVDGSEIDLFRGFLDKLGAMAGPIERATGVAKKIYDTAVRDLDCLRRAAVAPTERRNEIQAAKIKRLEEKLEKQSIGKRSRRTPRDSVSS